MDNCLFVKGEQKAFKETEDWRKEYQLD
jgi:hypothetical protein